tara:strand:+ start:628 stop:1986 length:1359 start_codon:yes stop_codon:yes gene_type:complete
MNNKKIFGILVMILVITLNLPNAESAVDQNMYGHNGTDWVPIQTDANGTIKFSANISSISWNNILDLPAGFSDGIDNTATISAWTQGANTLYNDSANIKIGILTPSPTHTLNVYGDANISTNLTVEDSILTDYIYPNSNSVTKIKNITILQDVHILGTLYGGSPLKIGGDINLTGNVTSNDGTGLVSDDKLIMGVLDGSHSWIQAVDPETANRDLAINPNGGNVGIGTTAPTQTLNVEGTFNVSSSTGGILTDSDGETIIGLFTTAGGALPDRSLSVYDDFASDYPFAIFNDGNNANRYGISIQAGADDASGTTTYMNFKDGDGHQVGYIENAAGTFRLVDGSDRRLKTNIVDTNIDGINTINNLKVREFNWKSSGEHNIGFIAQEIYEVYPTATSGELNGVNEDGTLKMMGVAKAELVPVLVKAIQEQQSQIQQLKQQNKKILEKLENENN